MVWAGGEVPRGCVSTHRHTRAALPVGRTGSAVPAGSHPSDLPTSTLFSALLDSSRASQPRKYSSRRISTGNRWVQRRKSCRCRQSLTGDEFAPLFSPWSEMCHRLLGSSICFPAPCSLVFQALIKVSLRVSLLLPASSAVL